MKHYGAIARAHALAAGYPWWWEVTEWNEGGEMETPNFDLNDKNVIVAEIRLSEGMTPSEAKTLIQENLSQGSASSKLSLESVESRQEFWNRASSKTGSH